MTIRHRCRSGLLLSLLPIFSACAADLPQNGPTQAVIIGFVITTPGEAPETLKRLKQAGAADARFVSSLSPRSHLYQLTCPESDPLCDRVMEMLRSYPEIEYASPDKRKGAR